MQTTLIATIRAGRPQLSDEQKKKLKKAFVAREGKYVQIAVGDIGKSRSGQQNRYYWGILLRSLAEYTGYSENEVHEYLKCKFLPSKYVNIGGSEIETRKSTTELTTAEFEVYMERVRAWAGTDLEITISAPNET